MTSEEHDDARADEAVAAAFAAYKADAADHFGPPPVDELIMRGPAVLRRRRLVSVAAVVGAATAVTAGGFAVAQTLGSIPKDSDGGGMPSALHGSTASDDADSTRLGDALTPEAEGESPSDENTDIPLGEGDDQVLLVGEWEDVCEGGAFEIDLSTWEFTDETDWSVEDRATGDVNGDDAADAVVALSCGGETAIAAFASGEDGLEQLAWVWQPDESQQFAEIGGVEDGVITLQGLGAASETWTTRYEWDGEAFVEIDEEPSTEPSSPETPTTSDPGETQPTQGTPTGDGQGS